MKSVPQTFSQSALSDCVKHNLQCYLDDLQGQEPSNMHAMLLAVVEKPLLEMVLAQTRNNQSKAAQWLGVNRNTLRKKLLVHGLLEGQS